MTRPNQPFFVDDTGTPERFGYGAREEFQPSIVRSERRRRRTNAPSSQPEETEIIVSASARSRTARIGRVPPAYYLGYASTSALTINRMIGTGIFVGPAVVLAITESKSMSMLLWLVGGIITWSGMSLYLEYGVRWPLTGGELHYIDRVWTYPEKLLTYLYSVTFVLLAGSYGNALVFGSSLIKATTPEGTPVDRRLQKFFSVVLIGFICIWQSYSRLNYILFSDLFALYKIILLTTITIMGWLALAGVRAHAADHYGGQYGAKNLQRDFSSGEYTPYGIAIALLQIFRVFTGWENVNYVLEEVQRPPNDPNRVYRRGIKVTILLVTFLYIMVNIAFFATSTTEEIIAAGDTLQLFFNKMFGPSPKSRVASGVLLCLSSTGNVMSATYTNVRVKQEIARMGLIPLPEFWASSTRYDTPGPALFLHWLFSTIVIILTPLDDPNGYLIVSTLFNYSRTIIEVCLGVALLFATRLHAFRFRESEKWKPQGRHRYDRWLLYPLAVIFIMSNVFVFVLAWMPSKFQNNLSLKSPIVTTFVGPLSSVSIYVFAFFYWLWDLKLLPALGYTCGIRDSEITDEGDKLDITINYLRDIKPNSPADKIANIFRAADGFVRKAWNWWFRNKYI